jgi:uncharacterized protein (TIGR02246 family)
MTAIPTDGSTADEKLIGSVLEQLYEGFVRRDATLIDGLYTDDADWTNAFGRQVIGNKAIIAYLAELFADRNFADGELTGRPQFTFREAGKDAVAVRIYTEIKGQRTIDGGTLPTRRNHSLKVLARQPDGGWRIVADMYMDARDEVTHRSR